MFVSDILYVLLTFETATINAENGKYAKYDSLARSVNAEFVPFVVETTGGITKTSSTLLNNITLACSEHQSIWSSQELQKELYASISVAIQRGNAIAMTAGYHWNISSSNIIHRPQPFIHPQRLANIAAA